MNDDYLWDKSGEPDPQIQQLEEILGTLRYQPKPLNFGGTSAARRRNYFALLAIAATVLIAFVAGGVWLQTRSTEASIPSVAFVTPATPIPNSPPSLPTNSSRKPRKLVVARHNNQEAVAAKQQLMFALRLASEKLNVAYRRTQSPTPIKNQHRAG